MHHDKEQEKMGNIKLKLIPIVVDALGMIPKGLEKRLGKWRSEKESKPQHYEDQLEFIVESWKPEQSCCHSDFIAKSPFKTDVKNSQGIE